MVEIVTVEQSAKSEQVRGRMGELYAAHARDASHLAFLLTGDRALADDLVQDAFVRVFGRFHDLRSHDAFWWYLRRTIVNLPRSHFRRRRVERAWLERQRPPEGASDTDVAEQERMRRALMVLRQEQRAAVVLRYYEDLTEAATAEALGVAIGTVKSMVSRSMDRLREELSRDE